MISSITPKVCSIVPHLTIGPNASGNHKKNLIRTIDESLKRLKLDYVDILYVHFWDFTMKPEDVMKILEDTVIKTGKALYLAVSDTPAWVVSKANTIAEHRGWSQFVAYQGLYSLINRDIEQEIVPCCLDSNIGIVPWGVLGSGKLTGRTLRPTSEEQVSTVGESQRKYAMTEEEFDIQDKVIEVAKELKVTPSQVVVNWTVNAKGITSPLIAPRSVEQLEDLFASLEFSLTEEQKKKLEDATKNKPARIFPAAMIGVGDDPSFAYGVPGTPKLFNIEMQHK
jgi:aryl-alcohol dehydrogenase-like predicted oxidoreductase